MMVQCWSYSLIISGMIGRHLGGLGLVDLVRTDVSIRKVGCCYRRILAIINQLHFH